MLAIPKDREGAKPQPERVFGSLPTAPGPNNSFNAITIPGLSQDLSLTYTAWQQGKFRRTHSRLFYIAWYAAGTAALITLLALAATRLYRPRL